MRWFSGAIAAAALAACTQEAPPAAPGPSEPPSLEAVALPIIDQAGNRQEALTQNGARWCTGDSALCIVDIEGGARVISEDAGVSLAADGEIWPMVIRASSGHALVGVIVSEEQMYSGGGGRAQYLVLYDVADSEAREALRLPYSGSLDIRACFTEEDQTARADACQDQYSFVSRVRLDESVASGDPRIVLETAAGTYPGRVSRGEDSRERGALSAADLFWAKDDVCSYRRTFSRGPTGAYAPDADLPACSDYLEP